MMEAVFAHVLFYLFFFFVQIIIMKQRYLILIVLSIKQFNFHFSFFNFGGPLNNLIKVAFKDLFHALLGGLGYLFNF